MGDRVLPFSTWLLDLFPSSFSKLSCLTTRESFHTSKSPNEQPNTSSCNDWPLVKGAEDDMVDGQGSCSVSFFSTLRPPFSIYNCVNFLPFLRVDASLDFSMIHFIPERMINHAYRKTKQPPQSMRRSFPSAKLPCWVPPVWKA